MAKKFLWKLWLRPNLMTKDVENDYYAEVSTSGHTMRNAELARRIIEEGSEIQFETLLSIFDHGDRIKREMLLSGSSVLDGVAHFSPRVLGNWLGATHRFDAAHHRITLDISPGAEMRKALTEEVDIEVLGIRDGGAYIGLVTDLSTGEAKGIIHRDEDIAIEGNKIRIAPIKETILGVFLTYIDSTSTPPPSFRIDTRLIQNDPKKIIARVPATLNPGHYQLYIVTRYSSSSALLNDPRTVTYSETLTVIQ
ncbi:MAG: DUF4469 domain-containing protein [Tannerella sp.]|jgi:hypothetical protein|nr:DUF4469 domain-containing protein [Tannerella sp.]